MTVHFQFWNKSITQWCPNSSFFPDSIGSCTLLHTTQYNKRFIFFSCKLTAKGAGAFLKVSSSLINYFLMYVFKTGYGKGGDTTHISSNTLTYSYHLGRYKVYGFGDCNADTTSKILVEQTCWSSIPLKTRKYPQDWDTPCIIQAVVCGCLVLAGRFKSC